MYVTKQPFSTLQCYTFSNFPQVVFLSRKTGTVHEVTVDNVTISITEYKVKSKKERKADGGKETEGRFAGSSNRNSDAESDTQASIFICILNCNN